MLWAIALALFAVLELWNFFHGSTSDSPTLSVLLDPITNDPVGRFVLALGWLGLGQGLVKR